MQELVTWFLAIGVHLFKLSTFLSLHSPSFFNFLFSSIIMEKEKKKNNGAANYDENTGSVGFGFSWCFWVQQEKINT